MSIDRAIGTIHSFLHQHGGKILTGISLIGLVTTTALACKATADIISTDPKSLPEKERTKFLIKKAALPISSLVVTSAAIAGTEIFNEKKIKALTATAAALGTAYGGYIATSKSKYGDDVQKIIDIENAKGNIRWKNTEEEYTFLISGTTKPFLSNYTSMLECQLDIRDLLDTRGSFDLLDMYDMLGVTDYDPNVVANLGIKQEDLIEDGCIGSISFRFNESIVDDMKIIYVEFIAPKFDEYDEFNGLPKDPTYVCYDTIPLGFIA